MISIVQCHRDNLFKTVKFEGRKRAFGTKALITKNPMAIVWQTVMATCINVPDEGCWDYFNWDTRYTLTEPKLLQVEWYTPVFSSTER